MKIKNNRVVCLFAVTAALATGCAVAVRTPSVYVPPPEAVVTVGGPEVTIGVPDAYVWDGVEFVGEVGGRYMYLGPGGGWLVCDSVRLGRFHGWEQGHPDWRRTAIRNSGPNARGRAPVRPETRTSAESRGSTPDLNRKPSATKPESSELNSNKKPDKKADKKPNKKADKKPD